MGIQISIIAGRDKASSSVNASGSIQHIISDEERSTFKVGDASLKQAVKAHFGKAPNDAYLHSPTPWNDLYKTYDWPQVQTVLVAQGAEILGITSEPVIVKTQEFDNKSHKKATFAVSISDSVSDTATSSWSTGGTLTVGQSISYGIKFLGAGVEGETSLSYSQSWGVGGEHSKSITLGSDSGLTVELEPGEEVVAELTASRGVLKVRVKYRAYLMGTTAVNYNPTFKDHHFWALDIGSVMASGGLVNSVDSFEDIEIGYYSNSKVELIDKVSGALKLSRALADVPAI